MTVMRGAEDPPARSDVIAVHLCDPLNRRSRRCGLLNSRIAKQTKTAMVDTSSAQFKRFGKPPIRSARPWKALQASADRPYRDPANASYIDALFKFFKSREKNETGSRPDTLFSRSPTRFFMRLRTPTISASSRGRQSLSHDRRSR